MVWYDMNVDSILVVKWLWRRETFHTIIHIHITCHFVGIIDVTICVELPIYTVYIQALWTLADLLINKIPHTSNMQINDANI